MPDMVGVTRNIILPSVPDPRGISGNESLLDLGLLVKYTFDDIYEYLEAQHIAIEAAYDELAKRSNEFLVESQWPETTKAQITANQNDYLLGDGVVFRLSSDAARNITGFATEIPDGHHKILINVGGFAITVQHQNAGSVVGNRVICLSGADTAIPVDGCFKMWKDVVTNRWRQI